MDCGVMSLMSSRLALVGEAGVEGMKPNRGHSTRLFASPLLDIGERLW